MLSVTVESLTAEGGDDIHVHAAGQGVWVARMAAELGADAVLCGFIGGETGTVLRPLLEQLPIELRLVETGEGSGAYIHDRRDGEREPVAQSAAMPPSRHEVDDLFSVTCAAALDADVSPLCGPYPGEALPLELYGSLVADVQRERHAGRRRPLASAPRQRPRGQARPGQDQRLGAGRVRRRPGRHRGPAARGGGAAARGRRRGGDRHPRRGAGAGAARRRGLELVPPRFERGVARGLRRLDDGRAGRLAWRAGREWEQTLRLGAAAGAANFLRHGLGSGSRAVVEELARRVELRPLELTPARRGHGGRTGARGGRP